MTSTDIYFHPDCLKHDTGPMHPESPARLVSVLETLRACPFADRLRFEEAPLGTGEQILLAHTPEYLRLIENSVPRGSAPVHLDPDTMLSQGSYRAALRAVGAGCQAVDAVMRGENAHGFCAVRPPGHHALPDRAMGFCLFNNIAIAARHAMKHHGIARPAIVDFDVHHGNGTQDMFARDANVLYVSTHQWPNWPGTGRAEEKGAGNILNVPLPVGTAGAKYREAFTGHVLPALARHKPDLLLVSAGFDAHREDPLASLGLVEDDYRWIGKQLAAIARDHCHGRVVSMLEGGYALEALADSTEAYLSGFLYP